MIPSSEHPGDQPLQRLTVPSLAAMVLCGGNSSRMGADKALMTIGSETMLQRMVRIVSQVAQPVVVVAAQRQTLPALPETAIVIRDSVPDRGPMGGLLDGFRALPDETAAAFVTGCDSPLLTPEFILTLHRELGDHLAVLPSGEPLLGIYRKSILPELKAAASRNHWSLRMFLQHESDRVKMLSESELATIDPEKLLTLNVNTPEIHEQVLRRLGLK